MRPFRQINIRNFQLIMIWCVLSSGCANTPTAEPSLFVRLGGLPAITAVTDKMIDQNANEPSTRRSFDGVKLQALKEIMVSYLCQATGGPCQYDGASMIKAHGALVISSAEFDATLEQLGDTLDQFHIPLKEKDELLQLLSRLKDEIVSK